MAFNYTRISTVTWLGTKAATPAIFTNGSGVTTYVRQILMHAPHAGLLSYSSTSLKLFFTPQQGAGLKSAQVTSQIFTRTLTTNETYLMDFGVPGLMLTNANDCLRAWHRAGTTIVFTISGGKE